MREMRALGFTEREAITAIIDLIRKQRQPLPSGQIEGLQLTETPVTAKLVVVDDYGNRTTVQKNAAEITAALVNYCIERRVRLPNKAAKFVEVVGGDLNLVVYVTQESQPSKLAARPAGRAAPRS